MMKATHRCFIAGAIMGLAMIPGVQAEHDNGADFEVVDDPESDTDIIVYTKDVSTSGASWVNPKLEHGTHGADSAKGTMFIEGSEVDYCYYPGLEGVIFCHTSYPKITLGSGDSVQIDGQVNSAFWGIHNFGPWIYTGS